MFLIILMWFALLLAPFPCKCRVIVYLLRRRLQSAPFYLHGAYRTGVVFLMTQTAASNMSIQEIQRILSAMRFPYEVTSVTPFCREEDGSSYDVWRIETANVTTVLKKVSVQEKATYKAFFPFGGCGTPKVYGFTEYCGDTYMLMEYFSGETMSHCTREKLILALEAIIQTQEKYWNNTELLDIGWTFEKRYAVREKRMPYMEDLADVYSAYLEADRTVPRTLCNDDLLPFNVLVNNERAVIIDWEFAGIFPYPCALARLLAFGEENTDFMFQMSLADKTFAVQYYYEHLIKNKGITWDEYIRTMKLFFFKEYSEWVYYARSNNDFEKPEYRKYYKKCLILASVL